MIREQYMDRYTHEKENIIIEVGVKNSRQLFNEHDPAPAAYLFRQESESPSIHLLVRQMEEFFMNGNVTYSVCKKCNGLNRVAFDYPEGKTPICGKCKISLPLHDGINELNDSSLQTLSQKSPLPVVVDFWAPWCGPCRVFAPSFIKAASLLKSRIVFGKVDTEANPNAGRKFDVRGIPTFIIFHLGKEISRTSGALPIEEFVTWVNQAIRK